MNRIYTLAEFSNADKSIPIYETKKMNIEKSVPLYETKRMTNRGYEYIPKNTEIHIKRLPKFQGPPLGRSIAMLVAAPLLAGGAAYLLEKSLGNPTRRLIKRIKHGKGRVKAHTRKGKLVKSHRRK